MNQAPQIHTFVLGDYQTNCFVVTAPGTRDCWIVDCGQRPQQMFQFIEREGLTPAALLLTHTHMDHIAGIDDAITRFGRMPMYVHEAEAGFCGDPLLNLSALSGIPVSVTEPKNYLKGGERITLGSTEWRVLHTPGHSPGGVCYIHDESKQAIVGDTLFAGSIGRVDFPTSDPEKMRETLFDKLLKLPDDMTIHPGHGPATTIGAERRSNAFLRGDWR
jgi:glyoxylase-like metal-dependent hydrolase (beta-lactamase superfamily II)